MERFVSHIGDSPTAEVMTALCLAAMAGAVLVAYMHNNPAGGADHYWQDRHPPTYAVMKTCQVVIVAAIAYNARFVVAHLFHLVYVHIRS